MKKVPKSEGEKASGDVAVESETLRDPFEVAVADRIRELRQSRGHVQEEFAGLVGLNRSYYSSIERGWRNLSLATACRIALMLEVTVADLVPGHDELSSLLLQHSDGRSEPKRKRRIARKA